MINIAKHNHSTNHIIYTNNRDEGENNQKKNHISPIGIHVVRKQQNYELSQARNQSKPISSKGSIPPRRPFTSRYSFFLMDIVLFVLTLTKNKNFVDHKLEKVLIRP